MQRVEQVEAVADQAQVPGANVLVATLDRLVRRADSALAAVYLVNEAFPIPTQDHNVVPESELGVAESERASQAAQVLDLSRLACAVQARKTHDQRFATSCVFHILIALNSVERST